MNTATLSSLAMYRLFPLALVLLLAGCGGGGGDGGGGTAATQPGSGAAPVQTVEPARPTITPDYFVSVGAASLSYVVEFVESAAAAIRETPEFKAQQRTVEFAGRKLPVFSYRDVRAEYPISVGLTGAGQTIAIIDDGFRLNHRELDGKAVKTYGDIKSESHGTAVAAIAAGKQDGLGMMGIAPGAGLHLSSFTLGFKSMAAATRDAQAMGAVVQNNSWGYGIPITDVQARLAANPGWSVDRAMQATLGGSLADMTSYLDALRSFTKQGVVVFAASNDRAATSATVMDALPVVAPELGAGWLVAINAIPQFQDDRIVSAERLSAGCLQMAHTCLAATGVVYSAIATSNTSYADWMGTSFAAPQIAAGVAILAEAFPGLPANDIRRRLLASASNGFYAHSGYSDFGNGVVHGYNAEFGHGFMDLRAALLPIGATGLPATNSAYGGVTPLGSTYVTSGEAQGDSVVRALAKENIAIFDSLGADFRTSALSLHAGDVRSTLAPRLQRFRAGGSVSLGVSGGGWSAHAGDVGEVLHGLGVSATATSLTSAPGNLAGLSRDALSLGVKTDVGGAGALSVYGFSSARPEMRGGEVTGLARLAAPQGEPLSSGGGIAWSQEIGGATISVGASFLSESDAALGMTSVGPRNATSGLSGAFDFAFAAPLPVAGMRLAISAQLGAGTSASEGLMSGTRGTTFSGYGLSLERNSTFRKGDALSLFVRQPLRMESGTAQLVVPQGRSGNGDVVWRSMPVDLTPSARQVDLGFEYATPLGRGNRFKIGAAIAHNEGHAKGATGVSLMGAFQRVF
jgi:subtilase-type serine protease